MSDQTGKPTSRITLVRREVLAGITGFVALAPVACGSDGETEASGTTTTGTNGSTSSGSAGQGGGSSSTSVGAGGAGGQGGAGGGGIIDCALTPEQTEGPFYLDDDLVRGDITEGKAGIPLRVVIDVVSLPDCATLPDHAVDIWHADHLGQYSGYPGQGHQGNIDLTGETFLRGTAMTDGSGRAEFSTIYPGWYPGRAVHIHFKVHLPGNMEVVSQLYFPDEVNDAVHQQSPYDVLGSPNTSNDQDGIYQGTTDRQRLLVALSPDGNGYLARLVVGIMPA